MQEMKTPRTKFPSFLCYCCILFLSMSWCTQAQAQAPDRFLQCLHQQDTNDSSISKIIYTPENSSYKPTLLSSVQNRRFASPPFGLKPLVIITPLHYLHVQSVVSCAKTHRLQLRIRCGGHDYEGLSFMSYYHSPFVIVDMTPLRSISINTKTRTAWVQGGVRLGQLYVRIAEKSPNLAFPAGLCPTVGVGGHISGGGEGVLSRKYGLAADHVVDAKIVDANGAILDRKSMGEDLFWAIRWRSQFWNNSCI